jgi:ribosome-associated protein
MADDLTISRTRVIPAAALKIKTARACGPGGQHVNRTESKIQLTFDPFAVTWIDDEVRDRLYQLAGQSVDSYGHIQIVSQQHRDQPRNLESAREKLADWVLKALVRPKKRRATRPTRASQERRLADKKRRAATKSGRTHVRDE